MTESVSDTQFKLGHVIVILIHILLAIVLLVSVKYYKENLEMVVFVSGIFLLVFSLLGFIPIFSKKYTITKK